MMFQLLTGATSGREMELRYPLERGKEESPMSSVCVDEKQALATIAIRLRAACLARCRQARATRNSAFCVTFCNILPHFSGRTPMKQVARTSVLTQATSA